MDKFIADTFSLNRHSKYIMILELLESRGEFTLFSKELKDLLQFTENIPGNEYFQKSMNFKGC